MDTTAPVSYPEPANSIPTRTPYAYHKWRLILRLASTKLVVLALILDIAGPATCHTVHYYYHEYVYHHCAWPIWSLVALPIVTVWNAAELITLCVNKKGIHPGAHIALDFLICGGLILCGIADVFAGRRVEIGAGVLQLTAALIHLALFVLACIAVHEWRKTRKGLNPSTRVIVAPQQPMTNAPTAGPPYAPTTPAALPTTAAAVPMAATSVHPYMSLPPPPPGMAYLVPIAQAQQQGTPTMVELAAAPKSGEA